MERMANTRGIYGCICILRCLWLRDRASTSTSTSTSNGGKSNDDDADNSNDDARSVLLGIDNKQKWATIAGMESHAEDRRQCQPELWAANQRNVVDFIRHYLGYGHHGMTREDEALIHELCGIWDTNAFEIAAAVTSTTTTMPVPTSPSAVDAAAAAAADDVDDNGASSSSSMMRAGAGMAIRNNNKELPKLRALFKHACLMAHDCVANTRHHFAPLLPSLSSSSSSSSSTSVNVSSKVNNVIDWQIVVRATVPIGRGDAITTCYTQPLSNTMARRAHLQFAKHFLCTCRRCSDPAELGAYLTAWKCQHRDCCHRHHHHHDGDRSTTTRRKNNNNGRRRNKKSPGQHHHNLVNSDNNNDNNKYGRLIMVDANDPDGTWMCDKCKNRVPASAVKAMEQKVNMAFAKLDKTVEQLEGFLTEFQSVLLPTTSYAVQVKYALVQMLLAQQVADDPQHFSQRYDVHNTAAAAADTTDGAAEQADNKKGNDEPSSSSSSLSKSRQLGQMTSISSYSKSKMKHEAERKEELCRELLGLMDVLSPGESRVRGLLLRHLCEALLARANDMISIINANNNSNGNANGNNSVVSMTAATSNGSSCADATTNRSQHVPALMMSSSTRSTVSVRILLEEAQQRLQEAQTILDDHHRHPPAAPTTDDTTRSINPSISNTATARLSRQLEEMLSKVQQQ